MSNDIPIWDSQKTTWGFYEVRMRDYADAVELRLWRVMPLGVYEEQLIDQTLIRQKGLFLRPFKDRVLEAFNLLRSFAEMLVDDNPPRSKAFLAAEEALDPHKALYFGEERDGLAT